MNDSGCVGGNQRGSNLGREVEHFAQLHRLAHSLSQRDAVDEFGGKKICVVRASDFIDGKNIWMVERRSGLRFLKETIQTFLIGCNFG